MSQSIFKMSMNMIKVVVSFITDGTLFDHLGQDPFAHDPPHNTEQLEESMSIIHIHNSHPHSQFTFTFTQYIFVLCCVPILFNVLFNVLFPCGVPCVVPCVIPCDDSCVVPCFIPLCSPVSEDRLQWRLRRRVCCAAVVRSVAYASRAARQLLFSNSSSLNQIIDDHIKDENATEEKKPLFSCALCNSITDKMFAGKCMTLFCSYILLFSSLDVIVPNYRRCINDESCPVCCCSLRELSFFEFVFPQSEPESPQPILISDDFPTQPRSPLIEALVVVMEYCCASKFIKTAATLSLVCKELNTQSKRNSLSWAPSCQYLNPFLRIQQDAKFVLYL